MADDLTGQVTRNAAEVYEEFFVPALFLEWAARVADAGRLAPGQKVLDVACGTGVLAREAARRVQPGGAVTGLDRNEGMLSVARRKAPDIDWRLGMAEFASLRGWGDRCGGEPIRADVLRGPWRCVAGDVARPAARWPACRGGLGCARPHPGLCGDDGPAAALVWGPRCRRPASPVRAGRSGTLAPLFAQAGIAETEICTRTGPLASRRSSPWVHTDVKGWTLADLIDDAQYGELRQAAETELTPYVQRDGTVAFSSPAHIVIAVKP